MQEQFEGTMPVQERHRFDVTRLERYMLEHVEGFRGPLEVEQFRGGQSNPTFLLRTPAQRYVLRRKPPGKLLPSAHAVDREFKVISALGKTGFPVAKAYAICTDDDVIGTMFYVMGNVEGRILWDGTLPDYEPAQRRAIYQAKLETLARLHNEFVPAQGLTMTGRHHEIYLSDPRKTAPEKQRTILRQPVSAR